MKKMLLMAAVLVTAACGEKKTDTPAVDTSAVVPATEPMTADTTMPVDTTMTDTTVARDTAAAPAH